MGLTTKAGEGFVSSLIQNLNTSYGEIASEIASNYSKSVKRNLSAKIINAAVKNGPEAAQKIADNIPNMNNAQFADDMMKTVKSGISDKEKFKWIRQQQVERHNPVLGNAIFAGQVAKAYMFQDGKKLARMGTYAAGSVGLRVISGGNLTHNNTGERDIAGIPFI
jgi:hypothetical protein